MKIEIILIVAIVLNSIISIDATCYNCLKVGQQPTASMNSADCQDELEFFSYTYMNTSDSKCYKSAGINQTCDSQTDGTCQSQLYCYHTTNLCVQTWYKETGETCSDDTVTECVTGNCISGTCQPSSDCESTYQCQVGKFCNTDTNTCDDLLDISDSCDSDDQCPYGSYCSPDNVCTALFSLNVDDDCHYHTQCNFTKGLYCNDGSCQVYTPTNAMCNDTSDSCDIFNEYCDCASGKCITQQVISSDAQKATTDFWSCMTENSCSDYNNYEAYYTPDSCAMRKCGSLFCQTQSYLNAPCSTNINDNPSCSKYKPTPAPTSGDSVSSSNQLTTNLLLFLFSLLLVINF